MAVEEVGTLGRIEAGGYQFSNQDVLAGTAEVFSTPSNIDWELNDPLGRFQGFVPKEGLVVTDPNGDHSYEATGTFTMRFVCSPDAKSINYVRITSSNGSADYHFDLDELLKYFFDCETLVLDGGDIGVDGTASADALSGVVFIDNRGGNIDVPVSNFSTSIERYRSNFRANGGLTGDWTNVSSGALSNLLYLQGQAGGSGVSGSYADLQNAAPNLVELISKFERVVSGGPLTELHGWSDLEVFEFGVTSGTSGVFADLDGTDGSGNHVLPSLRRFVLYNNTIEGDVGNMADHIEHFGSRGSDNDGATTWDNYMPSNFDQLKHLKFGGSQATHAALDSWLGSASNGGDYLNGHGHSLIFVGLGDENSSSWGWNAKQHPYRALNVKPNVSASLSSDDDNDTGRSYDPKAGWLDHWAVANVIGMPDSSTIIVKKPSSDGANDTNARDEGTDSDISIPTDGSVSGSDLHLFETTSGNRSDPITEAGGFTVYLVDGVVDDGASDELTINLDTANGPSLTDTGSGGYSAVTRMAVTW